MRIPSTAKRQRRMSGVGWLMAAGEACTTSRS